MASMRPYILNRSLISLVFRQTSKIQENSCKKNNMRRKLSVLIVATVVVVVAIIACNKRLNVVDINDPTANSYFKTAAELRNGVNAAYSSLRAGNLVGREWFFTHDMRGAETNSGGPQLEAPRAELLKQPTPAPSNSVMTNVWTGS